MMNAINGEDRIAGILVPASLVSDPLEFGGERRDDCIAGDLVLKEGRAVGLELATEQAERIVLPRLTEPHVHLDKCHSVHRLENVGGSLKAAIKAQKADMAGWTEEDLRARAGRGIDELLASGCGAVRTHVDWSNDDDPSVEPLAWAVLHELGEDAGLLLECAALTDIGALADSGHAKTYARAIAHRGGVLGAFVFDQPERDEGLRNVFREAERLGLKLDFHVDEGLEPELDGLERIADAALAVGFEGSILCGHACSLSNYAENDVARIADKLVEAGVAVTVLPQTNLYLQDRRQGTPDRRGLTRLHELRARGVTVALGADNVRDAFCPVGRHDPRHVLSLAVVAAHLDPPLGSHLPLITTAARRGMGLPDLTVDGAAVEDLLICDANNTSDLISGAALRPLSETRSSMR